MEQIVEYIYANQRYMSEYTKSIMWNCKNPEEMREIKREMIVDIHTHIMPDIDDGSRGIYESIVLLNLAVDKGITDVFLTPHSYFIHDNIYDRFDKFKSEISKYPIPIRLWLGCEVLSTPDTIDDAIENLKSGKYPTMNGTKYVLIEPYPYRIEEAPVREMIEQYRKAGFEPILAHHERYYNVKNLRGVLKQSNASEYQWKRKTDFIGSDTHRLEWREPNVIKNQGKFNQNCINYLNIKA